VKPYLRNQWNLQNQKDLPPNEKMIIVSGQSSTSLDYACWAAALGVLVVCVHFILLTILMRNFLNGS